MEQENVQHQQEDVQRQDEQKLPAAVVDDDATLSHVTGSALNAGNYTLVGIMSGASAYTCMKIRSVSSS